MAQITITFDVPETNDKCWTEDGVQCFYDAVVNPAHWDTQRRVMTTDNGVMREYYRRRLAVINSLAVDGKKFMDP